MAAPPQKADVTLTIAAQHQAAAAGLRAGQTVQLSPASEGGIACSTSAGGSLGLLGSGCPPLVRGAASATVRSIRCCVFPICQLLRRVLRLFLALYMPDSMQ